MTTELKKPVHRKTVGTHRGRKLIVSLLPGDVIGIREERCRKMELISIAGAYDSAVINRVLREKMNKKRGKK